MNIPAHFGFIQLYPSFRDGIWKIPGKIHGRENPCVCIRMEKHGGVRSFESAQPHACKKTYIGERERMRVTAETSNTQQQL